MAKGPTMAAQLDHYRLLGRSGLRVSPLALGTMTFGVGQGWGTDEAEAARMLDLYAERGGNSIDTANFYANGESERMLGKLLAGRRQRFVVASKYSLTMRPGDPNASGNHRKNMLQSVEASLQRLATDHIDLLYLHVWDQRTPVDEILRAFDDLVRAGKIGYIGLSDTPAWQASRMQAIAELRGWTQFCALQISYSLVERTVEREMIPMAKEMGFGVSPWAPLGQGVLTGKYSRDDLVPGDMSDISSRKAINAVTGKLTARNLDIADVVVAIAREIGCTPAQLAVAWTLANPAVCSPVVGVRTPAQLEDNLGALAVDISDNQLARLDEVSAVPPVFPLDVLKGPAEGMMFGNVSVAER
jgi:aryl-alcohol dehydrogenase-like predicted oxidoreductase